MPELKSTALAIIFSFVLFGTFSLALYDGTTDSQKQPLSNYSSGSAPNTLNYTDSGDPMNNMQKLSTDLAQKLTEVQGNLANKDLLSATLAGFGLLATMTIGAAGLLLGILAFGINMIASIHTNIGQIPSPWNGVAFLAEGMLMSSFMVYAILNIMDWAAGRKS